MTLDLEVLWKYYCAAGAYRSKAITVASRKISALSPSVNSEGQPVNSEDRHDNDEDCESFREELSEDNIDLFARIVDYFYKAGLNNASKMILAAHSNAGYCNEKNARSRAGGHFILSNDETFPPNNGAVLTNATITKAVIMSSAAEAKLGALYLNAKEAVYLRQTLDKNGTLAAKDTNPN